MTEAKAVLYRLSLEWLSSLLGSGNVRPEESQQLGRERQQKARKAPGRFNVLHPEVSVDSGPRDGCILSFFPVLHRLGLRSTEPELLPPPPAGALQCPLSEPLLPAT